VWDNHINQREKHIPKLLIKKKKHIPKFVNSPKQEVDQIRPGDSPPTSLFPVKIIHPRYTIKIHNMDTWDLFIFPSCFLIIGDKFSRNAAFLLKALEMLLFYLKVCKLKPTQSNYEFMAYLKATYSLFMLWFSI